MKTKHLLAIACVALIGQQAYAQQAELRPRSIADSTRTARLIGSLAQPIGAGDVTTIIDNRVPGIIANQATGGNLCGLGAFNGNWVYGYTTQATCNGQSVTGDGIYTPAINCPHPYRALVLSYGYDVGSSDQMVRYISTFTCTKA